MNNSSVADSTVSSAQLLLKMPSGNTIQLSQIPFIKERNNPISDLTTSTSTTNNKQKKVKDTTISDSVKDDLKARNRAAASRSRNKKKKLTEGFQKQIQILSERNRQLLQENLLLKKEIVQLKNQIDADKTTRPVIITLDQGYNPGPHQ